MPISAQDIVERLSSLGLKVMQRPETPDECALSFETESYVDPDGDRTLLIVCRVADGGSYLEFFTPRIYDSRACKYKAAFFAAMLQIAFMTKYVQLEHDPSDGEVRFSADMPVMDGTATARQLHAHVMCLAAVCEEFHPVLVHAMSTGKIEFERRWIPAAAEERPPAKPVLPTELRELIGRMGGIEKLEELLALHRATEQSP